MKRIWMVWLLAAMVCLPMRADAYRDALKQYMQGNQTAEIEQYETLLKSVAASYDATQADQVAKALAEYAKNQLVDDMTDMYEPAFRKHVSQKELEELAALYADPRYQAIQKRSMETAASMAQSQEYMAFVQQFQAAVAAITTGQQVPADIPVPEGISAEYAEAFTQYYLASHIDGMLMGTFQSVGNMLTGALKKEGKPNAEQTVDQLMQYVGRNMPTMMMTVFSKAMTIEDLQLLTQTARIPAAQHVADATAEIVNDPMGMALDLFKKMKAWMDVHYPQYAAPIQKQITDMQKVVDMMK